MQIAGGKNAHRSPQALASNRQVLDLKRILRKVLSVLPASDSLRHLAVFALH